MAELVPFESVATNVLAPAFRFDESTDCVFPVVPVAVPFNCQVVVHVLSFGTTAKFELVEPTADTLYVDALGVLEVTEQSFCTVTDQEQVEVS